MTVTTYADLLRPTGKRRAFFYDLGLVLGGSLLVVLSAWVAIPLPFSPVPITGQTLAVLLVGTLLGGRRGMASLLFYLLEGLAGLPVFAGGKGGVPVLLGPTGGYLVGFVAASGICGWLAERGWDRRFASTLAAMLLGNVAIYVLGLPWLACFVGPYVLPLGFYPFIPGDLLKAVLAATFLPAGWRIIGRRRRTAA